MPEIRYYTVIQERELKVCAPGPAEAASLANKVFRDEAVTSGDGINVLKPVREISLNVREDGR